MSYLVKLLFTFISLFSYSGMMFVKYITSKYELHMTRFIVQKVSSNKVANYLKQLTIEKFIANVIYILICIVALFITIYTSLYTSTDVKVQSVEKQQPVVKKVQECDLGNLGYGNYVDFVASQSREEARYNDLKKTMTELTLLVKEQNEVIAELKVRLNKKHVKYKKYSSTNTQVQQLPLATREIRELRGK